MSVILESAVLPKNYENYVFDLYGTLVDIHTDESKNEVWEKLALFFGYYGAIYTSEELRERYESLVSESESALKNSPDNIRYAHEASPEIEITEVFSKLYREKGIAEDRTLAIHTGQFFRALSTDYVRLYPGTKEMLAHLKELGKKVYLLSNAQRIFTAYEMNLLGIAAYFDDILISSDYRTKKPDKRFFNIIPERHKLDVRKTLYIGNDGRCDIEGAKNVNMNTFYVNSNISPMDDDPKGPDYIVKNFLKWEL
ncbi:MAG: HAD family hydrolase [Oscillospiraceae bacterium]